jgi:hypothetical protein
MKAALIRCFHLLMVVVVLTSSTGFGLVEHSCQMRGKRISSALFTDPCPGCSPEQRVVQAQQSPAVKRANCCKDEPRYEHVDVRASLSQLVAKFIKHLSEAVLTGIARLLGWLTHMALPGMSAESAYLSHAPPARSGRLLLIFIRQFLI